jgi:hypothetical protein
MLEIGLQTQDVEDWFITNKMGIKAFSFLRYKVSPILIFFVNSNLT